MKSSESTAKPDQAQKVPRDPEALARFGGNAARLILESAYPLETLANLLYLAETEQDPARVGGYLAFAHIELRRITRVYTLLLTEMHKNSIIPTDREDPGSLHPESA